MTQSGNPLTFKEVIDASMLNLSSGSHLTVVDVFIGLAATLICSAIIVWTYKKTYQGVLYQKSFGMTIVLAALVTTSVIMVISGNLVLSLGMVGALSIVRFRAAIKDPLDIVFMFWAISVGIANGVAYLKVSLTCTILLSLVMFIMKRSPVSTGQYLLILKHKIDDENTLNNILKPLVKKSKVKSNTLKAGNFEIVYEVTTEDQTALLKAFDGVDAVQDIALISYDNNA